jgi:hypothetical protein
MAVNQIEMPVAELSLTNRILGILCVIGAPMLLMQFILNPGGVTELTVSGRIVAFLGVLYMGGWLAGAVGIRRLRVTGNGLGSKIAFIIQTVGLFLATVFSVLDTLGFNHENGGLIFLITDIAYPFSHLFMIVVGIMTLRAQVWRGFPKFAPLMVGVALPLTLASAAVVGMSVGVFLFGGLTTIGLTTIGLTAIGYTIIKQS